jgi:hypothetical protein|tara:strand:- start:2805 stop:3137 length:333 start_codon:yes stop_codon:yes gene_type:complete
MTLSAVMGSVETTSTPSIASAATAIAANRNRTGFYIQNLGQNPLFVREGASASTTVFNYVLAAGTVNDDGTGGSMQHFDGSIYYGIVTIAGTAPRYVAWEYVEDAPRQIL